MSPDPRQRGARPALEICVETVDDVEAAAAGGADRIELASALALGGLTPSRGLCETVAAAARRADLELTVLCRPRPGDFLYDSSELEALERDLHEAAEAGAQGVALGVLTRDGQIDRRATSRLIAAARPLRVTFHRAFDLTRDLDASLEVLLELGCERVLTSGAARSAPAGAQRIAQLQARAGSALEVVAAGGLRPGNVAQLAATSGVRAVHASASGQRSSAMRQRRSAPALGSATVESGESCWRVADEGIVREIVLELSSQFPPPGHPGPRSTDAP